MCISSKKMLLFTVRSGTVESHYQSQLLKIFRFWPEIFDLFKSNLLTGCWNYWIKMIWSAFFNIKRSDWSITLNFLNLIGLEIVMIADLLMNESPVWIVMYKLVNEMSRKLRIEMGSMSKRQFWIRNPRKI